MTERIQQIDYNMLSRDVMAVAVVNIIDGEIFDWAAYISKFEGDNSSFENVKYQKERIALDGEKLYVDIAVAMFPNLREHAHKYRR